MISLLRQRNFSLLWFGGLISMIGDWMLLIALPIYVYQLSGSALATSITVMTRIIPRLLLGSIAGVFVDRWDRKQTMIISNLLLAINLLPLLLVQSVEWLWLIYLVSFIQSVISQFFGPAENAFLVRVVEERELVAANSLNSLNNNLARVIGPSLGGVVLILFDLSGIALIDAATFVIAGGMIALVTISGQLEQPSAQVVPSRTALWHEWRAGLRLVWREPVVSLLFVMIILTSIGEGR
jgi:MFS family permease